MRRVDHEQALERVYSYVTFSRPVCAEEIAAVLDLEVQDVRNLLRELACDGLIEDSEDEL